MGRLGRGPGPQAWTRFRAFAYTKTMVGNESVVWKTNVNKIEGRCKGNVLSFVNRRLKNLLSGDSYTTIANRIWQG